MIFDVDAQTRRNVEQIGIETAEDVRAASQAVVGFSPEMANDNIALQSFLSTHMYQHKVVTAMMNRARRVVRDLFEAYSGDPSQMPEGWQEQGTSRGSSRQARQICDFIAGMTDRYALDEHKRLFDLDPLFR
jgi:dGTPase